jgi:cytochrome c biogenesis protein
MFKKVVEAIWRVFVSLRLTFVLLILIAIGAILGMSFDQTQSFDQFIEERTATGFMASLQDFFELHDAFHSWWFSLSILLLSANLIACSIERLPRIFFEYRRPRPFLTGRRLLGLPIKAELDLPDEAHVQSALRTFFQKKAIAPKVFGDAHYYFYDRHSFGRFGVYIVHIALLIIMFSSIYATQNGIDASMLIEKGAKERFIKVKGIGGVNYTHDLGFYVGCDDFRLKTFVDDSPMEYESDLTITSAGPSFRPQSQTVRVNQPLNFAGFTFYQANYRPMSSEKTVMLLVKNDEGFRKIYSAKLNTPIKLPDDTLLTPTKIFEDFGGLGSALRLDTTTADGKPTFFHVFRKYPDFDKNIRAQPYQISLHGVDQHYATGLSVAYMPGLSIIFTGFAILLVGLYLCFLVTPARFFARVEPNSCGGFTVQLAAQAFRNQAAVKEEFNRSLALEFRSEQK